MPNKKTGLIWIAVIVVVVALTVYFSNRAKPVPVTITDSSTLPGMQSTDAPWQPEIGNLRNRLAVIGLPALSQEGQALHIHQHLDVYIHGKNEVIPSHIGINEIAGFISPIHVHDTTGIIHVESPVIQDFTFGQFFDIWGLRFSATCMGSYCNDDKNSLKVFVNGKPYAGNARDLLLEAHQEIVITYGTDAEIPTSIPSTYTFPAGY